MPAALHQPFLVSSIPEGSGQPWRRRSGVPVAALRGVESFEADFELTEQQSSTLNELLYSDMFCQQASACLLLVVRECGLPEGAALQFTGVLFQPRPWTPSETKGMPAEVEERYYGRPEQYTIINVPPVFMFQAKIFQPQRLCAVYSRV
ncbi:hypothetical protein ABPG77_008456 [Micractinium sp. CCAP 211/92]